jgi:hypothetical protein
VVLFFVFFLFFFFFVLLSEIYLTVVLEAKHNLIGKVGCKKQSDYELWVYLILENDCESGLGSSAKNQTHQTSPKDPIV